MFEKLVWCSSSRGGAEGEVVGTFEAAETEEKENSVKASIAGGFGFNLVGDSASVSQ